jgi:hypothetical protein
MKLALGATTVVCLLLLAGSTLAGGGGTRTKVESKTSGGAIASSESNVSEVSPNGRYLTFSSSAANLPGTDAGNITQVFLRDRRTDNVRLISRTTAGDPADDTSEDSSVSANGRRIVFESEAGNLPSGVAGADQVYVRDLDTGRTKLVSKTSGGDPANDESFDAAISARGRFVIFESLATNLPGGSLDTQVYVHDLKRGKTKLVSRASGGATADNTSGDGSISANGRIVTFESSADNLPGALGTGDFQAYARDLKRGRTKLVSKTTAGTPADSDSHDALLSDNGRYVGFNSDSSNLPGANPGFDQAYLHDRKTGRTKLVSRTSAGDPATGGFSQNPYPINSGRVVVFESDATNLPGDFTQIYLRNLKRGTTKLISRNNAGEPAADGADTPRNRMLADNTAFFDAAGDNMPGVDNQAFSRGPLR